jgi:hypothetical protein
MKRTYIIAYLDGLPLLGASSIGVVARAVVELSRDIESLPLASLGDFVRGRMGESARQVDGLFESLLEEAFEG